MYVSDVCMYKHEYKHDHYANQLTLIFMNARAREISSWVLQ